MEVSSWENHLFLRAMFIFHGYGHLIPFRTIEYYHSISNRLSHYCLSILTDDYYFNRFYSMATLNYQRAAIHAPRPHHASPEVCGIRVTGRPTPGVRNSSQKDLQLHSSKLTWTPVDRGWKISFHLEWVIFRVYVNLQEL